MEWQSVKQIVMQVKKVGEISSFATSLTKLSVPEDKYTAYMPDYVGRNLRSCGYVALSGEYRTYVGKGNIKIVIVTSDGSYVDLDDEEAMRNYVVTGQSVAPNSEIKVVYEKNSSGEEYSDWIDYMTYEEIDLYVSPIG